MVAAVLLLAVFVFLFSLFGTRKDTSSTATAQVDRIEFLSTQKMDAESINIIEKVEFSIDADV